MAGEAQAPEWAGSMVLDALRDAQADGRDAVAHDRLQEAIGIGSSDLEATLDVLREEGKIIEEAPGEWRLPYEDEERAGAAAEPTYEPEDDDREHATAPSAVAPNGSGVRPDHAQRMQAVAVETQLTAGMAKQLSPEALGQLVQAGIGDAEGRAFILTITP